MMGGPKPPGIWSGALDGGARIARSLPCFIPVVALLALYALAGLTRFNTP